jgi:DNA-binding MarR family transcriptional regulator
MKKSVPAPDDGAARESRSILNDLRRLVRGLHLYTRHCETRLGLSGAQLFALRKVHERGTLSLGELSEATLTDLSSVSVVAERLRKRGLLVRRRSLEDGRRIELSLSPAGLDLIKRSPDALQERLVRSLKGMPAHRRRSLERDLGRLLRDAGLAAQSARPFFEDEP